MAGWERADDALPSSHVFLTVSRGRAHKTFAIRWHVAFASLAALGAAGLWLIGCTAYVTFHDKLVASLMLRERDMQYDYEDRIAVLQKELDRKATQGLVAQRSINAKLDELTARESELRHEAGEVARLSQKVLHVSGHRDASLSATAVEAAGAVATPGNDKPHPDAALEEPLGRSEPDPAADRVSAISEDLDGIASTQIRDLSALDAVAQARVGRYRQAMSEAGLTLDRFGAKTAEPTGGPFVPLPANAMSPFDRRSLALGATLAEAERLKAATGHVPFDKPLEGSPEITSPFGPRTDPFLGRPALHTGVDLKEDTGTEVFATAPGKITMAGSVNGYGTLVEIDHGEGLTTRYAHLSATAVTVGQTVKAGEMIGRVGATGRATGPHLHYETRIDGEPVDPMRFLIAGHHLAVEQGPI